MAWTRFTGARDVDQEVGGSFELKLLGFVHPLPQPRRNKLLHVGEGIQPRGPRLIHVVTTKT